MNAILVTGAGGTLGRALLRRLAECQPRWPVVGLDVRPVPGPRAAERFSVLTVPFGGPFTREQREILKPVTHVLHLAAEMQVAAVPDGKRWTRLADPVRHLGALTAALPLARHLVFASSYMVYATPPRDLVTEDHQIGPINVYAWGKCAVEAYLRCLPVASCVLRFAGIYGPGVPLELGRSIMQVVSAAVQGSQIALYRPGTNLRNHLYIDDAVQALYLAAAEEWRGTFNVAGPRAVSVREVVDTVELVAGRPLPVRWYEGEPGWDAVLDTRLLAARHGFRAATDPSDGLREYYRWARAGYGSGSR